MGWGLSHAVLEILKKGRDGVLLTAEEAVRLMHLPPESAKPMP